MKSHDRSECWHLKNKSREPTKNIDARNKFKNNYSQSVYEGGQRPSVRQYSRDRYSENKTIIES